MHFSHNHLFQGIHCWAWNSLSMAACQIHGEGNFNTCMRKWEWASDHWLHFRDSTPTKISDNLLEPWKTESSSGEGERWRRVMEKAWAATIKKSSRIPVCGFCGAHCHSRLLSKLSWLSWQWQQCLSNPLSAAAVFVPSAGLISCNFGTREAQQD